MDKADVLEILHCNTEKDKHVRLNYHTAGMFSVFLVSVMISITGILAGIWPCGVITLLDELYISESKSQVYGAIHSFFLNNDDAMADLSKILIQCA